MSYVDILIERLGGVRQASKITGFPPTTVQSWKDAGSIHDKHKPIIRMKAEEAGVLLGPQDFFPHAEVPS